MRPGSRSGPRCAPPLAATAAVTASGHRVRTSSSRTAASPLVVTRVQSPADDEPWPAAGSDLDGRIVGAQHDLARTSLVEQQQTPAVHRPGRCTPPGRSAGAAPRTHRRPTRNRIAGMVPRPGTSGETSHPRSGSGARSRASVRTVPGLIVFAQRRERIGRRQTACPAATSGCQQDEENDDAGAPTPRRFVISRRPVPLPPGVELRLPRRTTRPRRGRRPGPDRSRPSSCSCCGVPGGTSRPPAGGCGRQWPVRPRRNTAACRRPGRAPCRRHRTGTGFAGEGRTVTRSLIRIGLPLGPVTTTGSYPMTAAKSAGKDDGGSAASKVSVVTASSARCAAGSAWASPSAGCTPTTRKASSAQSSVTPERPHHGFSVSRPFGRPSRLCGVTGPRVPGLVDPAGCRSGTARTERRSAL